jgi:hypothetical protein
MLKKLLRSSSQISPTVKEMKRYLYCTHWSSRDSVKPASILASLEEVCKLSIT